jgi:hypothetical protein
MTLTRTRSYRYDSTHYYPSIYKAIPNAATIYNSVSFKCTNREGPETTFHITTKLKEISFQQTDEPAYDETHDDQ